MKLSCQVTAEDMQDFLRAIGAPGSGRLFAYVALAVVIVIAGSLVLGMGTLVLMLGIIVANGQTGEVLAAILQDPVLTISVALVVPAVPVAIWWFRRIYRWQVEVRRQLKSAYLDEAALRDGVNIGRTEFDLTDDGIAVTRDFVVDRYLWTAFRSLKETESALLLMIDPGTGVIVPKRAAKGGVSPQSLKAAIAARIGARP